MTETEACPKQDVTDHLSPRGAFLKWALIGSLVATLLLVSQTIAVGGIEGLPQAGTESSVRPFIEAELGEVPFAGEVGHDGQIYYAMALDLDGDQVADALREPAYRYRRIFFPAVSSLFGVLDGRALLVGMITTMVVSVAAASGATAATSRMLGQSDWLALAVVLNPGVWLSVRLLTAEVLAIALMALGLLAFLSGRHSALVAFTLSVLTKEMFLLTPSGLAVSRDRRRWSLFLVPAGALLGWAVWVHLNIGGAQGSTNGLTLPFLGVSQAFSWWSIAGVADRLYFLFSLFSVAGAILLGATSRGWLRWSLLAWGALGVCSSAYVWRIGNNAARVFAPIVILIVLQIAWTRRDGTLTVPTLGRRRSLSIDA